jgi:HEAT repeat protein
VENRIEELLESLNSGDEGQAEKAVRSLKRLPAEQHAQAMEALRQNYAAPEVDRRWWSVRALAEMAGAEPEALLIRALGDADASVRQCAALALRMRPDPAALAPLLDSLSDPDPLAAKLAAEALAALGEAATPALLELLPSSRANTRLLIVRALAEIGDPRAIPALFEALDDDSALVEYWANEGLERMGVGMVFFSP